MNKVELLLAAREIQQRAESGPISLKTLTTRMQKAGLVSTRGDEFIGDLTSNNVEFIARVVPWMTGFSSLNADAWGKMVSGTDELELYDRWWQTAQNLRPYGDRGYQNEAWDSWRQYNLVTALQVLIGSQLGRIGELRPIYAPRERRSSWLQLHGIYVLIRDRYDCRQRVPPPEDLLRQVYRKHMENAYKI